MTISNRAKALQREPAPTDQVYARLAAEPWSPADPNGYVNLGTAENHLLFDLLAPRLAAARTVTAADTEYQLMQGMPSFRAELARFLGRQRGVAVDPEHLVVFGGSTGALDAVAYALCDPGDGIVIPTPYYSRLDDVLAGRAGAVLVPAPRWAEDGFALTAEVVERAIVRARGAGRTVRAVALLSPDNPLGQVYDEGTLIAVAEVVRGQGLQLVVDEVYAGSVYDGGFVSAAAVADLLPGRLHLVWGFAKDFGLSGFKTGVLHSTDRRVLDVARRLAMLSPVSSDTQVLLRDLLADDELTTRLARENAHRLGDAYAATIKALTEHGIGYIPAGAGLFVCLDLRPYLDGPTYDAELRLWQRIVDTARVHLSPGGTFHCAEPGWFRLCFAVPPDALHTGLHRLTTHLTTP